MSSSTHEGARYKNFLEDIMLIGLRKGIVTNITIFGLNVNRLPLMLDLLLNNNPYKTVLTAILVACVSFLMQTKCF